MSKVHILVGIPGSGKSTLAAELVKQGSCLRVNRDDIRSMIGAHRYGKMEDVITETERAFVKSALRKGFGVVVDNTNINPKSRNMFIALAEEAGAKFQIHELTTPLSVCIHRDANRERSVGRAVIERFAIRSGLYNLDLTIKDKVVFVDIDGTIADLSHREHHLDNKNDPYRWPKFFADVGLDTPIEFVVNWVKELSKTHHIILVSGRPWDQCGDNTIEWLIRHDVPFDRILMRLPRDKRPDTETKKEILTEFLMHHPKECIDFCIDDRLSIIKMWRENGLRVIPVGTWRAFE